METVKRWVVTHIGKHGLRMLAHPCQGWYTYSTKEEAQAWIDAAMKNNNIETLERLYGFPLEVREVDCYSDHHDPVGIYWD